jgi:sugar lactone lactonase YvrE
MNRPIRVFALSLTTTMFTMAAVAQTSGYTVITAVGGASPDGILATEIPISYSDGVAVDSAGNLYIAHRQAARVLKVAPNGVVSTVAGTGSAGFSGDGGPAIKAQVSNPACVAVDGAGNLYIADLYNNRVRKVDSSGIITTLAGSGSVGPPGQGYAGDGGPAARARLNQPYSLAADASGNVYIADYQSVIRKVDSAGTITTVAGTGDQGYSGDGGPANKAALYYPSVAVDGSGNLYIADSGNNVIRKVDTSGAIATIAGTGDLGYDGDGGPAAQATFNSPYDVKPDGAGNLIVVDTGNNVLRQVDPSGIVTTIAGTSAFGAGGDNGPALAAQFGQPSGVTLDGNGNLFVMDNFNQVVRKITSSGIVSTVAGNGTINWRGEKVPATSADISYAAGMALDSAGNLYIADGQNYMARRVDPSGIITTVVGNGIDGPSGSGGYTGDNGPANLAQLSATQGVAVDAAGNIYVADTGNNVVRMVDTTGVITTIAGTGMPDYLGDKGPAIDAALNAPSDVAVDTHGNLYITDAGNSCIRKVDSAGVITTVVGTGESGYEGDGGPAAKALLNSPSNVAIDASGNLYISDAGNNVIRKVSTAGIVTTAVGTGRGGFSGDNGPAASARLNSPQGVAIDSAGALYIADTLNNRIRKVDSAGIITTIGGVATPGISGDYGPAAGAQFNNPSSLVVSPAGNIYVGDYGNNRVRLMALTGSTACSFTLSSAVLSAPASGANGNVNVTTAANCPWTAISNVAWIQITAGSPSLGGKATSFTVSPNSGAARTGTIAIAGQTFTVTEAAGN